MFCKRVPVNFIHVRNLGFPTQRRREFIKFSQADEALRRDTGYHTCPLGAISLRRPVFLSRPSGTLSWLRTGGSRRRSIPASPTTSCASASTTNSIRTKSGHTTDRSKKAWDRAGGRTGATLGGRYAARSGGRA